MVCLTHLDCNKILLRSYFCRFQVKPLFRIKYVSLYCSNKKLVLIDSDVINWNELVKWNSMKKHIQFQLRASHV